MEDEYNLPIPSSLEAIFVRLYVQRRGEAGLGAIQFEEYLEKLAETP